MKNLNTRREFLQKGLGILAASATVPAFLDRTVWALDNPLDSSRTQRVSGRDGKILVVIQLSGGNDGLSMVVPFTDDEYYKRRKEIAIAAKEVVKLDDHVGLHPALENFKTFLDGQRLSVIQGVGYPNPNRSHFRSMDIWQTAAPDSEVTTSGWLGRYFDNTCKGTDPHVGISIGETQPLAMQGEKITPLTFERPEAYRFNGKDIERYKALNNPRKSTTQPELEFLTRTAMDAQLSSDRILKTVRGHQPAEKYPGGEFGNGLRTIAAMIKGGLPTRVYYVSLGGFDTHANQRGRHDNLMKQLADGLKAFWADMREQKNDDRVLMMTFSEFGRRVEQNASGGTDHGAAAPMFLIGPDLKTPIVGKHPSLKAKDLDEGDLKFGTDFRAVYAAVLEQWLQTPAKPVLGGDFGALPIWKS